MTTTGPLRVLLISSVRGVDPHSGDLTYTEQLLRRPPPGVAYTTYDQAIGAGLVEEVGSRAAVRAAWSARRPREVLRQLAVAGWRKSEFLLRRTGVFYREPLRVFRVAEGAFDLVHVHVFHTRFVGPCPPVVMSASGPLGWLYADAWNWPSWRIRTAEAFDALVGAAWDATICARRFGRAAGFVSASDYLEKVLVARGGEKERISVVANYLDPPAPPAPLARRDRPISRLGFVAKDFEAKGGPVVLAAYRLLRAASRDVSLTIVGSPVRGDAGDLAAEGIRWLPFVPREELLNDVLPTIDIVVYPSRCDALPYSVMEPLSLGIPLVVSDYRALPEMVAGGAGRVAPAGDAQAVAAAVEELLDRSAWEQSSAAAHALFRQRYSAESQAPRLGEAYARALRPGGGGSAAS